MIGMRLNSETISRYLIEITGFYLVAGARNHRSLLQLARIRQTVLKKPALKKVFSFEFRQCCVGDCKRAFTLLIGD